MPWPEILCRCTIGSGLEGLTSQVNKLQAWVDSHPEAVTVDQITAGLAATMNAMSEEERLKISRHLTGRAFDVRPVVQNGEAIKKDIRDLPGLHKLLDKEGGHVRWHAQFE